MHDRSPNFMNSEASDLVAGWFETLARTAPFCLRGLRRWRVTSSKPTGCAPRRIRWMTAATCSVISRAACRIDLQEAFEIGIDSLRKFPLLLYSIQSSTIQKSTLLIRNK